MVSTSAKPRPQGRSSPSRWAPRSAAMLFMMIFVVYFILPILYSALAATKTVPDLIATNGLSFGSKFALGDNLHTMLTYDNGDYPRWFLNTLIYAGASATGATLLCCMAGYALAKFRFRGRETIFAIMLGSIMVPSAALVLPLYLLMNEINLINTYWAVILPSMVNVFGVYLMRVYAASAIPDEMMDAARIDGSNEFHTFWSVCMPLLVPGFVTVFLLSFVQTWNNYFLPLVMLSDSKLFPVTLGLTNWEASVWGGHDQEITHPVALAGAMVAILPLIAVFLLLQRYWRPGLAAGSVKA
jgi:multiple sugar transport system permease protein